MSDTTTDVSIAGQARVRPFYCGSQAVDWEAANCGNCRKAGYYQNEEESRDFVWLCDIQRAKDQAFWGDGTVSAEMAVRMGNGGDCTEQEPLISPAEWNELHAPWPTRLAPLWWRLWRTCAAAYDFWGPRWKPEVDIWGMPGRISLRLAWSVAWGIWHDAKRRLNLPALAQRKRVMLEKLKAARRIREFPEVVR